MAFLSPLYFVPLIVWSSTAYLAFVLSIAWLGPGTRSLYSLLSNPHLTRIPVREGGHRTRWYDSLKKPPFQPSASTFAIVWTLLFGVMGLGAFFTWQQNTDIVGGSLVEATGNTNGSLYYGALGLYLAHLFPLAFWTGLFFRWKQVAARSPPLLPLPQ